MANPQIHQCYLLKPSRFALGFQILCLIIILLFTYLSLSIWMWMVCIVAALISLKLFNMQPKADQIEQLEYDIWSIRYSSSRKIQQVKIIQFIDHHFYIAVHFENKKIKPLIIWQDQVSKNQWKSLKNRCKFG